MQESGGAPPCRQLECALESEVEVAPVKLECELQSEVEVAPVKLEPQDPEDLPTLAVSCKLLSSLLSMR